MSELEAQDAREQGLPEEVADAWVTVLMDIWEKDEAAARQARGELPGDDPVPAEQGGELGPTT